MPHHARLRITGLLLALCLNAAFIAMFVWQARPRFTDMPEPSRISLVWAKPVIVAAPTPASPKPKRGPSMRPAAIAPAAVIEEEEAPPPELVLESESSDPFEEPDSTTAKSFDKAVMGKAIKVAMAERKALEDTQKFVKSGPGPTQYEQFATNVDEAAIPYCYRADAMKHTPPQVKVGGVTIALGSMLALPFFAKAIATGKCRMK